MSGIMSRLGLVIYWLGTAVTAIVADNMLGDYTLKHGTLSAALMFVVSSIGLLLCIYFFFWAVRYVLSGDTDHPILQPLPKILGFAKSTKVN